MDELLLKYDKLIYMMANKYKNYASIDNLLSSRMYWTKRSINSL